MVENKKREKVVDMSPNYADGGVNMQNKNITEKDLLNSEEKNDLKMDLLKSNLESKMNVTEVKIIAKIDSLETGIKNILLEQSIKDEKGRRNEKREIVRTMLTGTTVIVGIATLVIRVFFNG